MEATQYIYIASYIYLINISSRCAPIFSNPLLSASTKAVNLHLLSQPRQLYDTKPDWPFTRED